MHAYEFILPRHLASPVFRKYLGIATGGFTAWDAEGYWEDKGQVFDEAITVFRVAFTRRQIMWGVESALFQLVMNWARNNGEKALFYGTPARPGIYSTGN